MRKKKNFLRGLGFTREEEVLLEKLVEEFHTLPLDKKELEDLLKDFQRDIDEVFRVLWKAKEMGVFSFLKYDGRYLVYLKFGRMKKNVEVCFNGQFSDS